MPTTAAQTRLDRLYLPGLFVLTLATGVVDALSYIALDRVFTGNMTGNVLFIGFGLVGAADVPLLNNVVALLGFMVGALVCARVIRGHTHESRLPTVNLLLLVLSAVLAALLAVVWMTLGAGALPAGALVIVTAVLALVMGAQAAGVRAAGISDVTTIVVTSTLANLAIESRLAGGPGDKWRRRLGAVIAMGTGGALGALVIRWAGGAPALLLAAAACSWGSRCWPVPAAASPASAALTRPDTASSALAPPAASVARAVTFPVESSRSAGNSRPER